MAPTQREIWDLAQGSGPGRASESQQLGMSENVG